MTDTTSTYSWLSPDNNDQGALARKIAQLQESDLLRVDTNKGGGIGFRGPLEELFHLQNLLDLNDINTHFATTEQQVDGISQGVILRVASRDTEPVFSLLQEHIAPDWRNIPIVSRFNAMPLEDVVGLAKKHGAKRQDDYEITHVAEEPGVLPAPGKFNQQAGPEENYLAMGPNGVTSWIYFKAQRMEGDLGDLIPPTTGWKLHISASTAQAQEALARLAMDYKITEFKFAPKEWFPDFLDPDYHQCGKTAVFYHTAKGTDDREIDWEGFIRDAETIVNEHGGPGPIVQRDRTIPGSLAVHYRNDRGANGETYVPRSGLTGYMHRNGIDEAQSHNLAGLPDPFEHIQLDLPNTEIDRGRGETPINNLPPPLETPLKPEPEPEQMRESPDKAAPAEHSPNEATRTTEESADSSQTRHPGDSHRGKALTGLAVVAGAGAIGAATSWQQRVRQQDNPEKQARLGKRIAVFGTVTAIAVGAAIAVALKMERGHSR